MECGVCAELFTQTQQHSPLVLGCGHLLCRACVEHFLDESAHATTSNKKTPFACPFCRKINAVDEKQGVDGFPVSVALMRLLETELQSAQQNSQPSVLCDDCEEQTAQMFCHDCGSNFCSSCCESLHNRKLFKAHRRGPVTLATTPRDAMQCGEHNKPLDAFCADCEKPVCIGCVLNACKKHNTKTIEEAAGSFDGKAMSQTTAEIERVGEEVEAQCTNLGAQINAMKTWQTKQIASLRSEFAKIRRALDEREALVVQTIQQHSNARVKSLQLHKDHLDGVHQSLKSLLVTAQELLASPSLAGSTVSVEQVNRVSKWTSQSKQVCKQAKELCTLNAASSGRVCVLATRQLNLHTQKTIARIKELGKLVALGGAPRTHSRSLDANQVVIQSDIEINWDEDHCLAVCSNKEAINSIALLWELSDYNTSDKTGAVEEVIADASVCVVQHRPGKSVVTTTTTECTNKHVVFRGNSKSSECTVTDLAHSTLHTFGLDMYVGSGVQVSVGAPIDVCTHSPKRTANPHTSGNSSKTNSARVRKPTVTREPTHQDDETEPQSFPRLRPRKFGVLEGCIAAKQTRALSSQRDHDVVLTLPGIQVTQSQRLERLRAEVPQTQPQYQPQDQHEPQSELIPRRRGLPPPQVGCQFWE